VTITSQNLNLTELNGTFTLTDLTTGALLDQRNIFVGGVPGTPIVSQFDVSVSPAVGADMLESRFISKDPGESSSIATLEQDPIVPDNIVVPPAHIKPVFTAHLKHHRIKEVVQITSSTQKTLSGHLFLVVDGLNANITLEGAAGVTALHPPVGGPFVELGNRQIKPHKSIKVTLLYDDPRGLPLNRTFRLLEGTGVL
jgi:hypothetical protein